MRPIETLRRGWRLRAGRTPRTVAGLARQLGSEDAGLLLAYHHAHQHRPDYRPQWFGIRAAERAIRRHGWDRAALIHAAQRGALQGPTIPADDERAAGPSGPPAAAALADLAVAEQAEDERLRREEAEREAGHARQDAENELRWRVAAKRREHGDDAALREQWTRRDDPTASEELAELDRQVQQDLDDAEDWRRWHEEEIPALLAEAAYEEMEFAREEPSEQPNYGRHEDAEQDLPF